MNFLVLIESLALLVGAWYLWRRSRDSHLGTGRAFALLVFVLALVVVVNLWAESLVVGASGLGTSVLALLGVQIVRCLFLAVAAYCWLAVVRVRLVRSWRGVVILLGLLLVVLSPEASVAAAFLMALPVLRLKWTHDVHGWARIGLVLALGGLSFALLTTIDSTVSEGAASIHVFFGGGNAISQVSGDLPQPARALAALLGPWERALHALLVLLRLQIFLGFFQLLVVPIRLRGLSIKRRFAVTLAMYRFIPGTLALVFMVLIAYLAIGLHRASVIQHTFDATLDRCLHSADDLVDARVARGSRLPMSEASVPGEPAYAIVRDLRSTEAVDDTTAAPHWEAETRAFSSGTPPALLDYRAFTELDADTAIGLFETGGSLFLRAARIRGDSTSARSAEVFVAVDSTYLARLARRIQSDIEVDVSARVYIGEGSVQIVGGNEGGWTDSSFTIAAPFHRTVTSNDIWERRLYLARSFLPVGNWLDDFGDNRIGAVQLQLHTTPRGLFESLTSNALVLTSQLFAVIILAGIALLFFIVELSAVRTGKSIVKGIVTDVKNLTVAAQKFGEGNLSHRVELSGKDEMGQLAATFNSMAANIEQHQEVLLEKERLEADLALARDIQQRMLPQSPPVIPGLDVAGLSIPSREVGGDLFYFLPVSNGRLGLTIGDVSGKSVPAALLMSNVLAALKSEARIVDKEDEILEHLNRLIVEQVEPGRFVTFFYGVVDPVNRLLRYACAGHNPPLIMHPDGDVQWLHEAGVPLGVMPESTYSPVEATLSPGDVLVLYSDGVTEAQRAPRETGDHEGDDNAPADDEFFDEHRLETAVREARDQSAAAIVAHVMESIRTFTDGAEQSDDLTLVVVRMAP